MSIRRHGLMRPNGFAKLVALIVAFGMILGFASAYLAAAGLGMWSLVVAVLLLLGIPALLMARSRWGDRSRDW